MTCLTVRAERCFPVIDGVCVFELGRVAGDTSRTQARKNPACGAAMTGFARSNGVHADKRKAVRMMLHRINLNTPAFHVMTAIAGSAELAPMNVGMT